MVATMSQKRLDRVAQGESVHPRMPSGATDVGTVGGATGIVATAGGATEVAAEVPTDVASVGATTEVAPEVATHVATENGAADIVAAAGATENGATAGGATHVGTSTFSVSDAATSGASDVASSDTWSMSKMLSTHGIEPECRCKPRELEWMEDRLCRAKLE